MANMEYFFSKKKYALYLLEETRLLGCEPVSTLMNTIQIFGEDEELFEDTAQSKKLVRKLIYLTNSKPDIAFIVGLMSQFMYKPKKFTRRQHWEFWLT